MDTALAGGTAQVVEDSRGRKLGNAQQVCVLHIFGGIQAATGDEGVLDAGGGIRALDVDQKLIIERMFAKPGGRVQVPFPAIYAVRDSVDGLICKSRNKL
ncbi:MAG: hypothetical protein K2K53_10040 [Oscillospiraceae bacterium]|nr:hypothetical protein [Oscillospiraceae bacterium]